ncbi:MAG: DsrE family protein [Geminicoccaceae bacterium]
MVSTLKRIVAAGVLALALMGAPATAQEAAHDPTLVINLTTDDVWTNQMALGFAKGMHNDGHKVVVFLNVRAVSLASKKVPQHTAALSGKTPHEMIRDLSAEGVRVFVCPSCTKQAGLSFDDLIEGAEPGSPEYRQIVMAPGTRIMTY